MVVYFLNNQIYKNYKFYRIRNAILNNTNFKINESQSQQNISNIHKSSILDENKSERISFKFDMTSNFDLHSKFSKFDSTNNISRIKVPYYENNNYENNYILTNVSNMNDLNNITNLNNNNQNNIQNNNQNNIQNSGNPYIDKNKLQQNLKTLNNNIENNKDNNNNNDNENFEEEEIQLSITVSVRASKFEAMYPIWIEKNKEAEFKVIGKWSIDSTFPVCDCNGYIFKNKDFIKKENYANNLNQLNTINNNGSSANSSNINYQNASTNNTNMNINSKNLNSNNFMFFNSPNKGSNKNLPNEINDFQESENKLEKKILIEKEKDNHLIINNETVNKNTNDLNFRLNQQEEVLNKKESDKLENNIAISTPENNLVCELERNKQEINNKNENIEKINQKINDKKKINNNEDKKEHNNNQEQNLNSLFENYPNGCLIGRVLGGPYFRITSKSTFISEYSGPLFLKMNIHDLRMNPEGKLSVFINGAEDMSFMSIEKKLGWDINSLSLGCNLLKSESERLIYTFINKIRLNSKLFAMQYLENIKSLSKTTHSLYVNLFENKKSFKLLNMDQKLLEYGKKLLKREIERVYFLSNKNSLPNLNNNNAITSNNNCNNNGNGNSKNINNLINKNRQEILDNENREIMHMEKYLNSIGYSNLKNFIKKHEDTKPLSVAIKFIIDEKAQEQILSKDNNSIGLITIRSPMSQKGFFTCMIFGIFKNENEGNKTQNLITEINKNESEMMITD